jgi:hypothetical protein
MKNIEIKKKLIERDGLRCSVTGEKFDNPDDLSIEHLKPVSKGGTFDLDNLVLVSRKVNASISDNDIYRTKLLIEQLEKRQEELNIREKETFDRENSYRSELDKQKAQLEEYRNRLKHEQHEKENFLSKEMEERKRLYEQQANKLAEQTERLTIERSESEKLRQALINQKKELQLSFEEVEKDKERYREENRAKIEKKSNDYVNEALGVLKVKEEQYHNISRGWAVAGALSIAFGIAIISFLGVKGFQILELKESVEWSFLFLVSLKGLIVVGLFIALAKYSFTFSQSYMHESLKNSERRHAINFGKFYLESYGADAEWGQVKEAFEHWNISSSTAFSSNKSDSFDPKVLENVASLVDSVGKLNSKKEQETKPS